MVPTGPTGYHGAWHFQDLIRTNLLIRQNYHGTGAGGPVHRSRQVGNSISFDGTDDYYANFGKDAGNPGLVFTVTLDEVITGGDNNPRPFETTLKRRYR